MRECEQSASARVRVRGGLVGRDEAAKEGRLTDASVFGVVAVALAEPLPSMFTLALEYCVFGP